jgi:putative transposase
MPCEPRARFAKRACIKAQIDYKRRPSIYGGKPSVAVDNMLDRQFDVDVTTASG